MTRCLLPRPATHHFQSTQISKRLAVIILVTKFSYKSTHGRQLFLCRPVVGRRVRLPERCVMWRWIGGDCGHCCRCPDGRHRLVRSGAVIYFVSESEDGLQVVLVEGGVSYGLFYCRRQTFMPPTENPFMTTAAIEFVVTHIVY